MTLPGFFIAGAPKTGSTSLYHYLAQHPQIYMSPVKEPTYFGREDLLSPRWKERTRQQLAEERDALRAYLSGPMEERKWLLVLDRDDYLTLFRKARPGQMVGEASVSYFWLPRAAAAIREALPQARLIFVLRDPAEVSFSQYLSGLANRHTESFRSWFRKTQASDTLEAQMLQVPRYATHLGRFLALFPREQVNIHLFEDYRTDLPAVLRSIFTFLGVEPGQPIDVSRRHNVPVLPRYPRLHALRRRALGGIPLFDLVPRFLQPMARRLYTRTRPEMKMDPEDRRMVIDYFGDEITRTEKLLERDLAAWLR